MKLNLQLLASAALLVCMSAQAQTVSVLPGTTNVNLGDTFTVDLKAAGFPDKVFGGGYNIAYDPTILQLDDIAIPAATWEFARSTGLQDPASGTVTDVYFNTFVAPIQGDFLTSTLKFTAIGAGTSSIMLSASPSFPFGDELGNAVPVTYANGTVNVAAVPEPSSWMLLLTGLGGMGWASRKRRA